MVPASALNKAPNLTLVMGGGKVWRIQRDFPESFCRQASALQVNPIYRAGPKRNDLLLETRGTGPTPGWLEDLVAGVVLVPLPHG